MSFRVGFQHAHPAKVHHSVLVLRRRPVLVLVIVLEKNIAVAEPIFDGDRRDVYRLLMVDFGCSFDFPVELRHTSMAARSLHAERVHALKLDGSVDSFADTIDRQLWIRLHAREEVDRR